ncbi:MAG TPA: hypothetical protein VHM00_03605 [Caldimonas sp.]|nr:hypothetical protein [Caldimonas sp.]HEX2540150.1 hypothetical protein [Caldimonas sp.]
MPEPVVRIEQEIAMTQLPHDNDAWRRAGADARPAASGEQIERDPAGPTDAGEQDRSAADEDRRAPDNAPQERDPRSPGIESDTA